MQDFIILNALVINTDNIIRVGAIAAACTAIYGIIKQIAKPILRMYKERKSYDKSIADKIDRIDKASIENQEQNRKNYIAILQLKITNPSMPLEERLRAGHIYTDVLGQNGEVHIQYEMLQEEYKKLNGTRFTYDGK